MMTDESPVSRRTYLRGIGSAAAAGSAGLTGCSAVLGSSSGLDSLDVAYMPIYPDMQYFVMEGEGYFDELSVPVNGTQFPDGPSIVQASAKGNFDVMMFGIVPAMIIMDKGIPSKITAANIEDAMQILATDEFAKLWEQHGADAFAVFEEERGRKFTFGTFPPGSVPDILLRYWLDRELGLDPETDVNVKGLGGATAVQQALLAGEVDGTSIMEPVPTIIESKGAPFQPIAWAGNFMPGQPAAVTLMHDRLRSDNREIATEFVRQHRRATRLAENDPDAAAAHAASFIDSLGESTARAAMDSRASAFVTDPHAIEKHATTFSEYAARLGKTDATLSRSEMFDFGVYDSL
ncbi:MAG: ABC transporter substrate-binding protein [Haloarculaceae archaeon]